MRNKKQPPAQHQHKTNKNIPSDKTSSQFSDASKTAIQRKRKIHALRFILGFIILLVAFYLLYSNPAIDRIVFIPLANMYASISGKVLAWLGYSNIVVADIISSPQVFSVSVKKGCDAAEPMAIFMAGIVAFRAGIIDKLWGLSIGLAILFVLNIIRVVTLYVAGIHFPDFFEIMHLAVWQVIFILVAVVIWFLWLQKQGSIRTPSHGT